MTFLFDWISLLFMGFVFIISSLVILYSDDYIFGDLNIIRFILLVYIYIYIYIYATSRFILLRFTYPACRFHCKLLQLNFRKIRHTVRYKRFRTDFFLKKSKAVPFFNSK